mmetsp:Transcript_95909/g.276320  ORF Transcript_95909/g.276320 Transcript_95909/m.276320 type:complete len:285 (-) Transcript_95909:143-997(-)
MERGARSARRRPPSTHRRDLPDHHLARGLDSARRARRRLPSTHRRDLPNHHLARGLGLQPADILQARVREQREQSAMPQGRLAQLHAEVVAKEALDVRRGQDTAFRLQAEEPPQAVAHVFDLSHGEVRAGHGLLRHGALLLDELFGMHERHKQALGIPQQALLRDGQLHDVAHLPQGSPMEEGQVLHVQDPAACIAATGELQVVAGERVEISRSGTPHLLWVRVLRAAHIDEPTRVVGEQHRVLAALLAEHAEERVALADSPQAPGVHTRSILGVGALRRQPLR